MNDALKHFPINHKTVFILDHTPYFGISSCEVIDLGYKCRPNTIPPDPVAKSLWTCAVEAAMDYCRIVWDLFPEGKLIRVFVSDTDGISLNSWDPKEQNIYQIFGGLTGRGAPPRMNTVNNADYSIVHGFHKAIKSLCECTDMQHRKRLSLENAMELENRCRLICITSARNTESVCNLENIFLSEMNKVNKMASGSDNLMPIHHCHLIVVNVFPSNNPSIVVGHDAIQRSSILTTETYSVNAGTQLAPKLTELLMKHYNLASTTITNIPMKEEQNQSTSSNYSVELFHVADVHSPLLKSVGADRGQMSTVKEGNTYQTITLKWSMQKHQIADLRNCLTMHRITPADNHGRPTACLISFLLGGRKVFLDPPKKSLRGVGHILVSYGGEIYMQYVSNGKSVMDDPFPINEGVGGRVTDYRISDFSAFMKQNKLVPAKRHHVESFVNGGESEPPIQQAKMRLEKLTKHWPIRLSSNLIYNCRSITDPIVSNFAKEELSQEEVLQCKQVVYNLISMDAKNEPLPMLSAIVHGRRAKSSSSKREQHYKKLWQELENFVRMHNHSRDHNDIINCLLECRKKPENIVSLEKIEIEKALKGYEKSGGGDKTKAGGGERGSSSSSATAVAAQKKRDTVIRTTFDSPMSPPPSSLSDKENSSKSKPPKSLYDFHMSKKRKNVKLAGELKAVPSTEGYITKLYAHLQDTDKPKAVVEQ